MAYKPYPDFTRGVAPTTAYPNGDVQDDPGGTLVNRLALNDMWQTFQKVMINAGIVPSSTPDNVTNGFQILSAFNFFIAAAGNNLIRALDEAGLPHTTPILVWGLGITVVGPTAFVAEGWVMYYQKMVHIPAFSYPTSSVGSLYFTIGSVDGIPTVTAHAFSFTPPSDSTHFSYGDLTDFYTATGIVALQDAVAVDPWTTITTFGTNYSNGGGARFTKDGVGRIVQSGSALFTGTAELLIYKLPSGHWPSQTEYFMAQAVSRVTSTPGLLGFTINIAINTTGEVLIVDTGTSGFAVADIHYIRLSSIPTFLTLT